ncbi:MAG: hypothetical protein AMJ81_09955, partial [Phycisphaerae bacterium SM23_33]
MKLLWQIGKADNDTAEFALGRGGYKEFGRDGFFIVGRSDPKRDWPYAHPGPADFWAGGRAHTFTVFFGLRKAGGRGRLVVDLVDTHGLRPPTLRIEVNGRAFEHRVPRGASDASILGKPSVGREHRFSIALPDGVLKEGLNEIAITNVGLSWVLYDWLGLEIDGSAELAAPEGALLRSARLVPWLSRKDGKLSQPLEVTLFCLGPSKGLTLHATGMAARKLDLAPGVSSIELRLPRAEAARAVTVELRRAGKTLAKRRFVQKPAAERRPVDYVDCLLGTS